MLERRTELVSSHEGVAGRSRQRDVAPTIFVVIDATGARFARRASDNRRLERVAVGTGLGGHNSADRSERSRPESSWIATP